MGVRYQYAPNNKWSSRSKFKIFEVCVILRLLHLFESFNVLLNDGRMSFQSQ